MRIFRWKYLAGLLLLAGLVCAAACKNYNGDDPSPPEPDPDNPAYPVNEFVVATLDLLYLWNKEAMAIVEGEKIDTKTEKDPFDLFDRLVYSKDRWSQLTDDYQGLIGSVSGSGLTFGYSLAVYYQREGNDDLVAFVEFVYPDGPAAKAGLQRGDVIVQLNGKQLTLSNYSDLYSASAVSLGLGRRTVQGFQATGKTVDLTAEDMKIDPVFNYGVVEKAGHKVGYLHYTDFVTRSHEKLQLVFEDFKAKGVTDMVLDLRYNPGGTAVTSQLLSTILVPQAAVDAQEIFTRNIWNDDFMALFQSSSRYRERYMTTYSNSVTYTDFDTDQQKTDRIRVNLGLDRIYILTSWNSASASESTILGLMPYMDVVLIGEQTHGKYCGGSVYSPEDIFDGTLPEELDNWGMYVMLYRFTDRDDKIDFSDGFVPHYPIDERDYDYQGALGSEEDPMMVQALDLILGVSPGVRSVPSRSDVGSTGPRVDLPRAGGMIDLRAVPGME